MPLGHTAVHSPNWGGAAAESFSIVLVDHADGAPVPLGLALGQVTQVGDLRAEEQCRRAVGAGRYAGSGWCADVATGRDDPVEGAAVHDEVLMTVNGSARHGSTSITSPSSKLRMCS